MVKALLVDVVFDMLHATVYCDIVVTIIGQAKQNLVFVLVSREIDIMVTHLMFHQLIEKSSPQIWSQESWVVYSFVMLVHRYPN